MASCIEPLVTGFAAASGGTAEFYQAGTSTPSTLVFSDPEGTLAASDPHTLDGSGAIVRYVEERVRIVVKSAVGATVREWTHGQDAKTINVESTLFTGALSGGGTGVGGATTLANGLGLLATSLASEDGFVDPGTGDVLLSAALASSAGIFFNTKTGYSATGNGVADDTAEIQAAVNAGINASGGTVYFPPGTYPITTAITTAADSGLSFWGTHAAQSGSRYSRLVVSANGLTAGLVISTSHLVVRDLTFAPSASTTTSPLAAIAGGALNVRFDNCTFLGGAAACVAGLVGAAGAPAAVFHNCYFKLQSTSGSFTAGGPSSTSGAGGIFDNCVFDFGGLVPTGAVFDNNTHVFKGCSFLVNSTSGGVTVFPNSAGTYTLQGCRIVSSNSSGTNVFFQNGTCTVVGGEIVIAAGTFQLASSISAVLREAGCAMSDSVILAPGLGSQYAYSTTWQNRYTFTSPGSPVYTVSAEYANHDTTAAITGAYDITMPTSPMYPGARLVFCHDNTGAGTTNVNFANAVEPAATLTAGVAKVWVFRWMRNHITTPSWALVSESGPYATP